VDKSVSWVIALVVLSVLGIGGGTKLYLDGLFRDVRADDARRCASARVTMIAGQAHRCVPVTEDEVRCYPTTPCSNL
jgi:hypothetical protein